MGFYTTFTDPLARDEIVRYYQFLKRFDMIYRATVPMPKSRCCFRDRRVHEGKSRRWRCSENLVGRCLTRTSCSTSGPTIRLPPIEGQ